VEYIPLSPPSCEGGSWIPKSPRRRRIPLSQNPPEEWGIPPLKVPLGEGGPPLKVPLGEGGYRGIEISKILFKAKFDNDLQIL